jgi:hypothetical protein
MVVVLFAVIAGYRTIVERIPIIKAYRLGKVISAIVFILVVRYGHDKLEK